jgi:hypothetical protein
MNNVMLDLETISNGPNAAIISIGAVMFDPSTGNLGAEFYTTINIEDAMKYGQADGSTIAWWMRQSDEARAVFNDGDSTTLEMALIEFSEWISQIDSFKSINVWGNGCSFDNVILSNAYNKVGMKQPWPFWGDRDVRTIVDLGRKIKGIDPKKNMQLDGVAHNALDDAKFQAKYVSEIFNALAV